MNWLLRSGELAPCPLWRDKVSLPPDNILVGPRVGDNDVARRNGRAVVSDISLEDVWALGKGDAGSLGQYILGRPQLAVLFQTSPILGRSARGRAAVDDDVRAVHVHFAVAEHVEPRPGKHGVSGRRVVGNVEWIAAAFIRSAASHASLNDGPCLAIVVGQGRLAGSAAVGHTRVKGIVVMASG